MRRLLWQMDSWAFRIKIKNSNLETQSDGEAVTEDSSSGGTEEDDDVGEEEEAVVLSNVRQRKL